MLRPFSRRGLYVTLLQSVRTTITEELPPSDRSVVGGGEQQITMLLPFSHVLVGRYFGLFLLFSFRGLFTISLRLLLCAKLCSRELKQGTRVSWNFSLPSHHNSAGLAFLSPSGQEMWAPGSTGGAPNASGQTLSI